MSAHYASQSTTWWLPDNLDVQMLQDAQACLRYLQGHQTPSGGQIEAWERFHATYARLIGSFVSSFGVHDPDAEDCCQEVWKDIFQKFPAFHSDGTQAGICSWLKTIAHSKATNFIRYRARHPSKHLPAQAEAALPSREAGPVDAYEQQYLQGAVERVMALLRQQVSATSFRVLWMRSIEERTTGEIAAQLHLTPAQVGLLFHRTKQKFRLLWERLTRGDISPQL